MIRAAFAALSLTLFLLALPAAAATCPSGPSVREVDPETRVIVHKTRLTPQPDQFDPMLLWTSDEPSSITFVVVGNGAIVRYPTCYALTLFADGRTVALGQTDHKSETGSSRAVEYMTADLTLAEAQRLASAKTVFFKICNDERPVSEDFLCQAREVVEAAAAWKPAAAVKK